MEHLPEGGVQDGGEGGVGGCEARGGAGEGAEGGCEDGVGF